MLVRIGQDILQVLSRKSLPPYQDLVSTGKRLFDLKIITPQDSGFKLVLIFVELHNS